MSQPPLPFLCCGILLLLSLISGTANASGKTKTRLETGRLSGQIQLERGFTPESGVQLLEDILQRVRNSPQLALAKQGRWLASETRNRHSAVTDYRLAIKPKEPDFIDNRPAGRTIASPAPAAAESPGIWERNQATKSELQASSFGDLTPPSPAASGAPGIWEKPVSPPLSSESQQRLGSSAGKLYGLANALSGAALKNQEESSKFQKNKRTANILEISPGGRLLAGNETEPNLSTLREYKVALLPPNVVTGIALIHLGSSQTQAQRALKTLGTAQSKSIGNWTIWSYPNADKTGITLQIYLRHGQVEALRIFDNSLVTSDLGVRLGDNLSTVKQRFGEPSFILAEPQSASGQNYIYPISQIGFLLSRPDKASPPQVSSLLIFNIK